MLKYLLPLRSDGVSKYQPSERSPSVPVISYTPFDLRVTAGVDPNCDSLCKSCLSVYRLITGDDAFSVPSGFLVVFPVVYISCQEPIVPALTALK